MKHLLTSSRIKIRRTCPRADVIARVVRTLRAHLSLGHLLGPRPEPVRLVVVVRRPEREALKVRLPGERLGQERLRPQDADGPDDDVGGRAATCCALRARTTPGAFTAAAYPSRHSAIPSSDTDDPQAQAAAIRSAKSSRIRSGHSATVIAAAMRPSTAAAMVDARAPGRE